MCSVFNESMFFSFDILYLSALSYDMHIMDFHLFYTECIAVVSYPMGLSAILFYLVISSLGSLMWCTFWLKNDTFFK